MFQRKIKYVLGAAALAANLAALPLHAQVSQSPLLNSAGSVEPNIVLMVDDSRSMMAGVIYDYGVGGNTGASMGVPGPQLDPTGCTIPSAYTTMYGKTIAANTNLDPCPNIWVEPDDSRPWGRSPDVNRIAYDPRVQYVQRVNANGTGLGPGPTTGITSFKVYFLRVGGTALNGIASVSTTSSSGKTFSAATGNTEESDQWATGTTVSFAACTTKQVVGAGTGAAITNFTVSTRRITGFTVTPGSGYTATARVQVRCGSDDKFYPVTLDASLAGGVNQVWDGVAPATTLNNYFTTNPPGFTYPGYLPPASALQSGATLLPYPNVAQSGRDFPKYLNRVCAAATHCTWAEELQNYANWKAYHSTRIKLAATGIGLAFQPFDASFRLGWATIHDLQGTGVNTTGSTPKGLISGVKPFSSGTKTSFFTWLYGLEQPTTSQPYYGLLLGGTPNRIALDEVGKYYQREDPGSPWAETPSGNTTSATDTANKDTNAHASCRRAYSMLMTDGYYNDSFTIIDWDSTNRGPTTTPSIPLAYNAAGPYSDKTSGNRANTLADVAMKYYLSDLRIDLTNNVAKVTGDNAIWQHMNFYAIGLGVGGKLPLNDAATLQQLTSPGRTLDWPDPVSNQNTTIDDTWHATINGRGRMLNAKTASELREAVAAMMSDINGAKGIQAGVAVSTASLTAGTKKYTPSFFSGTWAGNLAAYKLSTVTGSIGNEASLAWQVESDFMTSEYGKSTSTINDIAGRKIYVGDGANAAVEFKHASMSSAQLTQMGTTPTPDAALINYLRGDSTNAGDTKAYRPRTTILGDIVNSTPVFVKDSLDMEYGKLGTTSPGSDYAAYITAKKARTEGVVFVGANDGMLHAFRDGTYAADGTNLTAGGAEVFAYVPYAVLPTISRLSDKSYLLNHRYYVDGPMVETDAYIGGAWKNLVIGTTGAGTGKNAGNNVAPQTSVFAINVTALSNTGGVTNLNASSVLWEVGSWKPDFEELGHVLHDVQTGVTVNGEWVAIFGNGYGSKSCRAQLFVVNLANGNLLRRIDTTAGGGDCTSATNANANGLGGVRVVRDDKQQIVGAYAGDLQGHMWRFDLSGAGPSTWSFSRLYQGTNARPITAPPTVATLPFNGVTDPKPGYMVVFGTGKFHADGDVSTTAQQGLYGIWDDKVFGTGAPTTVVGTTTLQIQTITAATDTGLPADVYFHVSKEPVDYATKRGWYINLTSVQKQRMIYPMELLAGRFVVADTMSPLGASTDPCSESAQGVGILYVIDALSGAGPSEAVLDTNGDGNIDTGDVAVAGVKGAADGRNVSLVVSQDDLATKYANVSGADPGSKLIQISCRLTNTCKVAGGGYRRQWRQLFLR